MMYLLGAIVGHLVGDYLMQNDWMALGKKKSSLICAVHCALWTLAVCVCGFIESPLLIAVLFLTHFAQDRTGIVLRWMKLIGQEKFATGPLSPWSIIVVDNVWHIATIYFLWRITV